MSDVVKHANRHDGGWSTCCGQRLPMTRVLTSRPDLIPNHCHDPVCKVNLCFAFPTVVWGMDDCTIPMVTIATTTDRRNWPELPAVKKRHNASQFIATGSLQIGVGRGGGAG
jgi:hypothetical protein